MIDLFQPQVGPAELAAVAEVFDSRWLGHGPRTAAFEAAFAAHLDVPSDRVLFLNSGTSALFLAIELLDLRDGDEVVMPSVGFVAAANAVVACGARPVFCDVDPRTLNPTAADVEGAVTSRTRAVVLLHYGGWPGDVARIAAMCRARGLTLVEDAACSVASRVDGRACGTFGDLAMWSFDAMKTMVTGDGGMLYVRDERTAGRARPLAYHGLAAISQSEHARTADRWWDLDVREPGRRVIGNDLTAAIGLVQLERLPEFVERRREIAAAYDAALAGVPGLETPPEVPGGHESTHYFYWVQMDSRIRDRVARDLFDAGIYTTFRYAPLHRVPLYEATGAALPGAEEAAGRTLCLPNHPGLDDADVATVAAALRAAVTARAAESGRAAVGA